MPSANVAAVRRGVEAWSRQDVDAMLREYDPDVHVVDPERAGAGPFVGHQAFRRWFAEWLESWAEYDIEHEAIIEVGNQVVLFQRHVGRAKGSGIAIDHRGALKVELRDGKVAVHRPFTHRADALAAAGLDDAEDWRNAIETIVAGYEAWNRRDVDALVKIMEPDAEFVPIEQSMMQRFTGPEGMRNFFESSVDVWEEFLFTPVAFVLVGDALLVELDAKGTARASGIVIEEHWAHVYSQRNGRLVRFQAFRAKDDALAALAYPDPP